MLRPVRGWISAAILLAALAAAPAASAQVRLANRCISLSANGDAVHVYAKPTGLRTFLLYDGSATRTEWTLTRHGRDRVSFRSGRRAFTLRGRRVLRVRHAKGCRVFPEAGLGAHGRPIRGSLLGWADPHVHITADLRAGGQVISGEPFDRFGIADALGRDADVHGPDGSLDVTGDLLRSGNAAGTHDTQGWPAFTGWPTFDTYTHQQVYYRWLQRAWMAGLRLVVAQTVEDQPLCDIEPRRSHSCDETATIDLEIQRLRALQDYVDAQSGGRGRGWFRLVYSARQAERVIRRGKLAVIVGVESSDPFGCSERLGQPNCGRAAIDSGIAHFRSEGVRTIFLAHWVDNALAGAALEGGAKGTFIGTMQLSQTGLPFQTGPCPHPGQGEEATPGAGKVCNTRGLTDLGRYAVGRLIDEHMLIEVDHMSEVARDEVLTIAEQRHYAGIVSSHTGTGGAWDPSELRRLYALGGFGSATIDGAGALIKKVLAFRAYGTAATPGLSTDTGGFAAMPGPADDAGQRPLRYPFRAFRGKVTFTRERTGTRTFDLNKDGVAHYGLIPDLLADAQRRAGGRRALGMLFHSSGAYLRTWRAAGG